MDFSNQFDFFNSIEDVVELLIELRIATRDYPQSESRYANIQEFLKEYRAL